MAVVVETPIIVNNVTSEHGALGPTGGIIINPVRGVSSGWWKARAGSGGLIGAAGSEKRGPTREII